MQVTKVGARLWGLQVCMVVPGWTGKGMQMSIAGKELIADSVRKRSVRLHDRACMCQM